MGCHVLLQGIFPTQRSNQCLVSPALAGRFFTTRAMWLVSPNSLWILHYAHGPSDTLLATQDLVHLWSSSWPPMSTWQGPKGSLWKGKGAPSFPICFLALTLLPVLATKPKQCLYIQAVAVPSYSNLLFQNAHLDPAANFTVSPETSRQAGHCHFFGSPGPSSIKPLVWLSLQMPASAQPRPLLECPSFSSLSPLLLFGS